MPTEHAPADRAMPQRQSRRDDIVPAAAARRSAGAAIAPPPYGLKTVDRQGRDRQPLMLAAASAPSPAQPAAAPVAAPPVAAPPTVPQPVPEVAEPPAAQATTVRSFAGAPADGGDGKPPPGVPSGLAGGIQLAARGGGRGLAAADRAAMQRAFGTDLAAVRLHDGPAAASLTQRHSARAMTAGNDVFLAAAAPRAGRDWTRLLAHEIAHVVQARAGPSSPGWQLGGSGDSAEIAASAAASRVLAGGRPGALHAGAPGTVRRSGAAEWPVDAAAVTRFVQTPASSRMTAAIEGLTFRPVDTDRFDLPDGALTPTAVVLARLADTAYDPAWPAECIATTGLAWVFDNPASPLPAQLRLQPGWVAPVLGFLQARIGDRIAITAQQRALVIAGEALNPVPPEILREIDSWVTVTSAGSGPPTPNFLTRRQAILNQLATMWWDTTQAYVTAWLTWRGARTPENLTNAALELDALFMAIDPFSSLLGAIHADTALQQLPQWRQLWPGSLGGPLPALTAIVTAEAVAFTAFAASQPRDFRRLARTDAAARRSMLLGYANSPVRSSTTTGDQPVSAAPSPYNAPPLPIRMEAYPAVVPPAFQAVTGARTTFFTRLQFDNFYEAMSHAMGGWVYSWDLIRVPGDDIANLSNMSVPSEEVSDIDALEQTMARDLRYAAADRRRIGMVARLTSMLGPPGLNVDTLMAATTLMDLIGSAASQVIRTTTRPSSEYDVTFNPASPGLYLVRCRVGPSLADTAQVAQFRRLPSVAWLPVYARPAEEIALSRLREEGRMRSDAEDRFAELTDMLAQPVSYSNQADLEEELRLLNISLHGTGLEVLRAQRVPLDTEKTRLEAITSRTPAQQRELTDITERLEQLDLMIAMRVARDSTLGTRPFRLPATFVKHDGTTMSLMIEAAQLNPRGPRWYVSDLTTPRSGQERETGDGTLAPEYPNEDSILAALKKLLESPSGYGRGELAVHFPPGLDRPGETTGRLRHITIDTDLPGIAMHMVENVTTLISIAAVVAAPFTGGATLVILMPIGIIGALPSAYRLVHRGQMGTLRFDLETAMEIVDILGAILQLGEIGAGVRAAARAGTRAGLRWTVVEGSLWIAGVGANGMGMMMMGAQMLHAMQQDLNGLPPGLRVARIAEILGNAMVTIGIQAGAHLASRGHVAPLEASVRTAAGGVDGPHPPGHVDTPSPHPPAAAEGPRPAGYAEPTAAQRRGVPGDLASTPLDINPELRGNTVRVEYRIGGNGRVDASTIRIVAARGASATDIGMHAEAARAMHSYAGILGAVHEGIESLRSITGSRRTPPQGSPAWEAHLELAKLRDIINLRMREMSRSPTEERMAELGPEFLDLQDQLANAQRILAGHDAANPRGFIAAESLADRRARTTEANRNIVRDHNIRVVVADGTDFVFREPAAALAGAVDPAPSHTIYVRDGRPIVQARVGSGIETSFSIHQRDGHYYLVPDGALGRPIADGSGGTFEINRVRPDFAGRRASAVLTQPPPARRNAALEAALNNAGLPDTDLDRAILRRWGAVLDTLDTIQSRSLGQNVPTGTEAANLAVRELMGDGGTTYIEARYDDFRRAIRQAAIQAIIRAPVEEQMGRYNELYRSIPDPASMGELWTAYRVARGALAASDGGFGGFRHFEITAMILEGTPVSKLDGAITVDASIGTGGPPPGNYGLESKAGGSSKPEQAQRYSDHMVANGGRVVMAGGSPVFDGMVYMYDNHVEARAAVTNFDANHLHPNIYVTYVNLLGRVVPMPRAGVAAAPSTPAAPAAPSGPAAPPPPSAPFVPASPVVPEPPPRSVGSTR